MYDIRVVIWLFLFVGPSMSLLIRLEETTSKQNVHESADVTPDDNVEIKTYQVVDEHKKKSDEGSSDTPERIIFNRRINRGRQGYTEIESFTEDVSDRIDNVETKVDALSNELGSLESMASIYFLLKLFTGLFFSFI